MRNVPQYLKFPSAADDWMESSKWLQLTVNMLWPYMRPAINELIIELLQPILDFSKPSFISKLWVDKLDLGSQPPQVGGW